MVCVDHLRNRRARPLVRTLASCDCGSLVLEHHRHPVAVPCFVVTSVLVFAHAANILALVSSAPQPACPGPSARPARRPAPPPASGRRPGSPGPRCRRGRTGPRGPDQRRRRRRQAAPATRRACRRRPSARSSRRRGREAVAQFGQHVVEVVVAPCPRGRRTRTADRPPSGRRPSSSWRCTRLNPASAEGLQRRRLCDQARGQALLVLLHRDGHGLAVHLGHDVAAGVGHAHVEALDQDGALRRLRCGSSSGLCSARRLRYAVTNSSPKSRVASV